MRVEAIMLVMAVIGATTPSSAHGLCSTPRASTHAESASPPLVVPPVPAIPGAPLPTVEDEASSSPPPLTPEEVAAHEAAAAASPRVSNFGRQRVVPQPPVPPASVRRRQEIHLVPSEERISDRNAMSTSLRILPADLRMPSNFKTVYEVEQRPDVLVRANGAVYAVYPQGDYALAFDRRKKPVIQTLIPAGTTFYIGEPDWRRVWLPGIRGMMPKLRKYTAEEYAAREAPENAAQRVDPTMPHDFDGVFLLPTSMDEYPGIGRLETGIDTLIRPGERGAGAAFPGPSSDETIAHPVLGRVPEQDPERMAPQEATARLQWDDDFRRGRMNALIERLKRERTAAPSTSKDSSPEKAPPPR